MKTKSTLKKTIIWICIILMVASTLGVYVVYMFAPVQEATDENITTDENVVEILPGNIDSENPDATDAPIVITNEEDETISDDSELSEEDLVDEDLTIDTLD